MIKRLVTRTLLVLLLNSLSGKAMNADSLINSLRHLPDSARCDSLIKLARKEVINGWPEAVPLAKEAVRMCKVHQFRDLLPKARFYLAAGYDQTVHLDSMMYHYQLALEEMKGTPYENWDRHVYTNVSSYLRDVGQYQKSLEYRFKILAIAEEENDSMVIAQSYTDIGYIYDRMRDYHEAIQWHRKALPIFLALDDSYYIAFVLGRIGIAYDDLGVYDSAHYYNFTSLERLRELKEDKDIATWLSNIGNTYSKQKNWKEAEKYLREAAEMNDTIYDVISKAISNINLGYVYTEMGNYPKAEYHIRKGLLNAHEYGEQKFIAEANFRLYQLFEKQQRMDSALHYFQAYKQVEDSLYSIAKSRQIAELRTIYETDKKEQQIEYQQLEIHQKESDLTARRNLIWALVSSIVLIIIAFFGIYNRFRARKNAELQKAIIIEKEKGLEAVINAQEEERKRISKDLHDGIGQQLSGLKMGMQRVSIELSEKDTELGKKLNDLTSILNQSAEEVRSISHQMMPRVLTELGLIPAMEDMLNKSLGNSGIDFEFEHLNINKRFSERVELSLYRVCQELINNIIKHSNATRVHVQLFVNREKLIMIVEDNGKGMDENTRTEGQGLMNIKSRLSTVDGEVNYQQSPGSGTMATIRVPIGLWQN